MCLTSAIDPRGFQNPWNRRYLEKHHVVPERYEDVWRFYRYLNQMVCYKIYKSQDFSQELAGEITIFPWWNDVQSMAISGTDLLEVPTIYIYKQIYIYIYIYIRPKFQGISPQNMAKPMVRLRLTYLHWSWRSPIHLAHRPYRATPTPDIRPAKGCALGFRMSDRLPMDFRPKIHQ